MATGSAGLLENLRSIRACDDEWDEHTTNVVTAAWAQKNGYDVTADDVASIRKIAPIFMKDGSFIEKARNDAYAYAPSFAPSEEIETV